MDDLERTQRWMQSVITHYGGVRDGLASADARQLREVSAGNLEQIITRSKTLSAEARLGIYAGAYYARLLECLRSEFPALLEALGGALFDQFSFGYLQKYPSHSYTLGRLGAEFPRYLAETSPPGGDADASTPLFLVDLARLEWAVNEAFDAPGPERRPLLNAADLRAIPPERWPDATLSTVECLRLLELDYAVGEYYSALRRKQAARPPSREKTWLAVCRRDYVVRRHALSRTQFTILSSLAAGGAIGDAVSRAAADCQDDLDDLSSQLAQWFQRWAAAGFFRQVTLPA